MRLWRKRILLTALTTVCIGGVLLLRTPILTAMGNFLMVRDRLEPSDIIFVLNGDVATRPFQAAKLRPRSIANQVVIARAGNSQTVEMGLLTNNITDLNIAVMKKTVITAAQI